MVWNRHKGEVLGKHLSSDLEISDLKIWANNRLLFSTMKSPVCDLYRTRALGLPPFSSHPQQVPSLICSSPPPLTPKVPISNKFDWTFHREMQDMWPSHRHIPPHFSALLFPWSSFPNLLFCLSSPCSLHAHSPDPLSKYPHQKNRNQQAFGTIRPTDLGND